jgi:K+-transporting ATPase KdpF subunit
LTPRRPTSAMNENICLGLLALLLFGYLAYVLIRPEEF